MILKILNLNLNFKDDSMSMIFGVYYTMKYNFLIDYNIINIKEFL